MNVQTRRGRPRKERSVRERVSFTLSPEARRKIEYIGREANLSRSDVLNKLILEENIKLEVMPNQKLKSLAKLAVPNLQKNIANFCKKNKVCALSFFGSILRDDFGFDSDVDVLVTFEANSKITLLDQIRIEDELSNLLGRKVDLLSSEALKKSRNWLKKKLILENSSEIYEH